jgi:hypothetical protein
MSVDATKFNASPTSDAASAYIDAAKAAGSECKAAALDYISRGWSALALCPPDHYGVGAAHAKACSSQGKVPIGPWKVFQSRLTTTQELEGFWKVNPTLNVGCALGPVSGLIGLDVDGDAGEAAVRAASSGDLPPTLEFTSGAGRRLLYRIPAAVKLRPTHRPGGEKHAGYSLLGEGSQTVMPPSRHANGRRYEWVASRGPGEIEPAFAPHWIVAAMQAPPFLGEADRTSLAEGELIPEGRRDRTLISLAGKMRHAGFSQGAIYAALSVTNQESCRPPLADSVVREKSKSAARYDPDPFAGVTVKLPESGTNGTPTDSVPVLPLKGENRNRIVQTGFSPSILCSDLRADDPNKLWLWRPYVAPESITLFSALWKAGKTTLLAHLLRSFGHDETFCGRAVTSARVLYVTEESQARWAARRDRLTLGDWIRFRVRPFMRKPSGTEWYAFIHDLVAELQADPADLVVMDTISNLWPVVHENDAGEVTAALMPLRQITAAQILVHHLKKNDGKEATGSRGSGALMAFADTILELRRFNADDHTCRRRVLTSWGRDEESQGELVIELNETRTGYDARGSRDRVSADDLVDKVAGLLPALEAEALTIEQIHTSWPDSPPPHRQRLLHALSFGTDSKRWNRSGKGVKGSPYRYWE